MSQECEMYSLGNTVSTFLWWQMETNSDHFEMYRNIESLTVLHQELTLL